MFFGCIINICCSYLLYEDFELVEYDNFGVKLVVKRRFFYEFGILGMLVSIEFFYF